LEFLALGYAKQDGIFIPSFTVLNDFTVTINVSDWVINPVWLQNNEN